MSGGLPTTPMPTPVPTPMPPATATPAPTEAPTPEPSPANPAPASFDGYWGDHRGNSYRVSDGVFYRYGIVSIQFTACGGTQTLNGETGTYCEGEWFNRSGELAGYVRGVAYYKDNGMPYFETQYSRLESPESWARLGLRRFTDAEVQERGTHLGGETQ